MRRTASTLMPYLRATCDSDFFSCVTHETAVMRKRHGQ
jgi:hypothetical protein